MDAFRRIFGRINQNFSDLTASQRLAIGMCVVVIVGAFLWLVRWSAVPQMVRLLEEPMTTTQLAEVRKALPAGSYQIIGDHVLVPPSKRHDLFWRLQDAGALPEDTSVTFAKLIEDDSPFRPESENQFRRRVALQNELAKVIASSRVIRSAEVFITDTSDRRISSPNTVPTASIQVTLANGHSLDQEMVNACAAIVAGAVPGLVAYRVSVVDGTTLRTYAPPNPENSFGQGLLQEAQKNEEHLRAKILEQLSYIPGVRVAVTVSLDSARKQIREFTYADPAVAEEQSNTTETQSGSPSGETGVGPNVGQSLAARGGGDTSTTDDTRTKFQDQRIRTETTTVRIPLTRERATASIGIPWSYVTGVLKKMNGNDEEPATSDVDARFEIESARVSSVVKNIIMAEQDGDVTVGLFPDLQPVVTVMPDGSFVAASGAADGPDTLQMLRDYGPQGGLAMLAVFGLLMMSRLAKRSAREAARTFATSQASRSAAAMDSGETFAGSDAPVGLAEPGEGAPLVGREVNEEALRGSEMTRQVSEFVSENPKGAARLIRQWADGDK